MKIQIMYIGTYIEERKVYHGSYSAGLTKLNTRQHGIPGHPGRSMGIYLTHSRQQAETFGTVVYTVNLRSKKILNMTKWASGGADESFIKSVPMLKPKELEEYLRLRYYGKDSPYNALESLNGYYGIVNRLKKKYDGIVFREEHGGVEGITYVIWNKNVVEITGKIK